MEASQMSTMVQVPVYENFYLKAHWLCMLGSLVRMDSLRCNLNGRNSAEVSRNVPQSHGALQRAG